MKTNRQRFILKFAAGFAPVAALIGFIEPADPTIVIIFNCVGIMSMSVLQVLMMDLIINIYTIGFLINNARQVILDKAKNDQEGQQGTSGDMQSGTEGRHH
tara:strand:+ start:179 stop:481 length:303 start_codon:yes stop_codon:yes gene_type:complete